MKHPQHRFPSLLCMMIALLLICGCADEKIVFNEIKHSHERLKISELNQYLQIIRSLPDKKSPSLPPLYTPVPHWDSTRELSVKGLVKEEQKRLPNRWFSEMELAKLSNNHPLMKAISKQNLSIEQFLGLTETIAMAAARTHFKDVSELRRLVRTGQHEVAQLLNTEKVFANFLDEEQFDLIRRAAWLCRLNRAQNLLKVPEENMILLQNHWDVLSPYLPEDALRDPLADIVDSLLDYGLPFEELPKSGSDITLQWSPLDEGVIIGRDKPFQQTASKR